MNPSSLRLLSLARVASISSVLLRQIPSRSLGTFSRSPSLLLRLPLGSIRAGNPLSLPWEISARFASKKTPKKEKGAEKGGKKAAAASKDDEDEDEDEEKGDGEEGDEGGEVPVAELLKQADQGCKVAMEKFKEHYNSLRIGGASPGKKTKDLQIWIFLCSFLIFF